MQTQTFFSQFSRNGRGDPLLLLHRIIIILHFSSFHREKREVKTQTYTWFYFMEARILPVASQIALDH